MKDCPCSLAPTDEELMRYALDGTALSDGAAEHITQCRICQQRLEHYCDAQHFLLAHAYRCQCPDSVTLGLYCMCLLSIEKMDSVKRHLMDCPLCQADLAATCQSLDVSATGQTEQCQFPQTLPCASEIYEPEPYHLTVHPAQRCVGAVTLFFRITYDDRHLPVLCGRLEDHTRASRLTLPGGVPVELFRVERQQSGLTAQDEMELYARLPPYCSTHSDQQGTIMLPGIQAGRFFMIVYLPETALVVEDIHIM